jgi:hypothetical protein
VKLITTIAGEVTEMQIAFDGISNPDYVKKLAKRVKRGHDGVAREGRSPGALAYGYDAVLGKPGERLINKDEAAIVRRIFVEYASGRRDRCITPTIIKTFYWVVIALVALFGLSGVFSGLASMAISPFSGFLVPLSSIAGAGVGIVSSRIVAELILIIFRINEHLGVIRDQGGIR